MQLIPLILLILGLDMLAFTPFATLSEEWGILPKTLMYSLYWFFPFATFLYLIDTSRGGNRNWSKSKHSFIRAFLSLSYLSKFLIIVGLLLFGIKDLFVEVYYSIIGSPNLGTDSPLLAAKLIITFGLIPFCVMIYGILRNPYRYKVFKEIVSINGLPKQLEGLKIVQISDIHSGSFTKKEPVRDAIRLINQQDADLVFFTGDLVNSIAAEMDNFIDVFDKINSKYGTFSILGNHDYGDYVRWENAFAKNANFEKLKNTHKLLGWDLMLNENRLLEINGEKVAVIGVENYSANARFHKYGKLGKAYEGTDEAKLKLLLSHDPSHWEAEVLKNYQDIDITFSGHTHGAQFGLEIPGWIKWSPIKYVYHQWAGLYQKGSQFLYVNRGLGFLGYPGRVGILPEITVIELKSK